MRTKQLLFALFFPPLPHTQVMRALKCQVPDTMLPQVKYLISIGVRIDDLSKISIREMTAPRTSSFRKVRNAKDTRFSMRRITLLTCVTFFLVTLLKTKGFAPARTHKGQGGLLEATIRRHRRKYNRKGIVFTLLLFISDSQKFLSAL